MKSNIEKLKKTKNMLMIALDMGISESSLYNYINNYKPVSKKMKNKIEDYLKNAR